MMKRTKEHSYLHGCFRPVVPSVSSVPVWFSPVIPNHSSFHISQLEAYLLYQDKLAMPAATGRKNSPYKARLSEVSDVGVVQGNRQGKMSEGDYHPIHDDGI